MSLTWNNSECYICFDSFTNPINSATFPFLCKHGICKKCYVESLKNNKNSSMIKCHYCKKELIINATKCKEINTFKLKNGIYISYFSEPSSHIHNFEDQQQKMMNEDFSRNFKNNKEKTIKKNTCVIF